MEIRLPPVQAEMDRMPPDVRKHYEGVFSPDFNTPFPWSQGPRRMGTDKNADVLWVGNSWGGNLARIDTRTMNELRAAAAEPAALSRGGGQQPQRVDQRVDDRPGRQIHPGTSKWTMFDLPTRGSEVRYVSLEERDGTAQVVLP